MLEETPLEKDDEIEEPTLEQRLVARHLFIVLAVLVLLAGALVAFEIVEHLIHLA